MEIEKDKLPNILRCIKKYINTQIVPMTSIVGSIAAQEIIKYTGKYTPLNQWFIQEMYSIFNINSYKDY